MSYINTDITSLKKIKDSFLQELKDADSGKATSLPYVLNTIPKTPVVQEGESFQVAVIGGTHCSFSICKKQNNAGVIISSKQVRVPDLKTDQDFFRFLESHIPETCSILACNFAFPLIPEFINGILDGRLLRGTKGHTLTGLTGKLVGKEIDAYFLQKRGQKLTTTVANDTICLLLSGLEKVPFQKLGAGIVGSGMNFAFFRDETTAINLESADFNKFESSETGILIDKESTNPGHSTYEKEVSGVYLFQHYNKELELQNLPLSPISKTAELDILAQNGETLAIELLHRSAKLIACQIAAIMDFRRTNMTFIMEGSVFWKGLEYKKTVEETVSELTSYKSTFTHIQNSNIIGGAHLVI